eukprot:CAMPEP_0170609048 /NCGR_PEP_ID=MMETSP0224-20130122/21912_1 /TAXON_ID=285029 /ORGANISM="Togula jolla, Strain CCCM 725" /LENGTH=1056 /DNA_ID=CAMNT_0010934319 /DNA_START=49 /DNA_END=3219 /DNA_ORIENTATION=-
MALPWRAFALPWVLVFALLSGVTAGKVLPSVTTPSIGSSASLAEEGYQAVVSFKSDEQMGVYVQRVLELLGREVSDEGDFNGFVPYYSGTTATQSYSALLRELQKAHWTRAKAHSAVEPGSASASASKQVPETVAKLMGEPAGAKPVAAAPSSSELAPPAQKVLQELLHGAANRSLSAMSAASVAPTEANASVQQLLSGAANVSLSAVAPASIAPAAAAASAQAELLLNGTAAGSLSELPSANATPTETAASAQILDGAATSFLSAAAASAQEEAPADVEMPAVSSPAVTSPLGKQDESGMFLPNLMLMSKPRVTKGTNGAEALKAQKRQIQRFLGNPEPDSTELELNTVETKVQGNLEEKKFQGKTEGEKIQGKAKGKKFQGKAKGKKSQGNMKGKWSQGKMERKNSQRKMEWKTSQGKWQPERQERALHEGIKERRAEAARRADEILARRAKKSLTLPVKTGEAAEVAADATDASQLVGVAKPRGKKAPQVQVLASDTKTKPTLKIKEALKAASKPAAGAKKSEKTPPAKAATAPKAVPQHGSQSFARVPEKAGKKSQVDSSEAWKKNVPKVLARGTMTASANALKENKWHKQSEKAKVIGTDHAAFMRNALNSSAAAKQSEKAKAMTNASAAARQGEQKAQALTNASSAVGTSEQKVQVLTQGALNASVNLSTVTSDGEMLEDMSKTSDSLNETASSEVNATISPVASVNDAWSSEVNAVVSPVASVNDALSSEVNATSSLVAAVDLSDSEVPETSPGESAHLQELKPTSAVAQALSKHLSSLKEQIALKHSMGLAALQKEKADYEEKLDAVRHELHGMRAHNLNISAEIEERQNIVYLLRSRAKDLQNSNQALKAFLWQLQTNSTSAVDFVNSALERADDSEAPELSILEEMNKEDAELRAVEEKQRGLQMIMDAGNDPDLEDGDEDQDLLEGEEGLSMLQISSEPHISSDTDSFLEALGSGFEDLKKQEDNMRAALEKAYDEELLGLTKQRNELLQTQSKLLKQLEDLDVLVARLKESVRVLQIKNDGLMKWSRRLEQYALQLSERPVPEV